MPFTDNERDARYEKWGSDVEPDRVNAEDCPCFYGGSCPSDYKHKDQPVFDCPECGQVTAHYSHCKLEVQPTVRVTEGFTTQGER